MVKGFKNVSGKLVIIIGKLVTIIFEIVVIAVLRFGHLKGHTQKLEIS